MKARSRTCWRRLRSRIEKVGDFGALRQLMLASCECAGSDDCVCSQRLKIVNV
jgi:hypothetical protein